MHEKGYAHYDVKPQNFMLLRKVGKQPSKIRIIDFGSSGNAKACYAARRGTKLYMAPEEFHQDTKNLKVDTWALGVTIIETLGLQYHFDCPKDESWGDMRFTREFVRALPGRLHHEGRFSPALCHFLTSCFIIDSDRRPSAKQLATHPWLTSKNPTRRQLEMWDSDEIPSESETVS